MHNHGEREAHPKAHHCSTSRLRVRYSAASVNPKTVHYVTEKEWAGSFLRKALCVCVTICLIDSQQLQYNFRILIWMKYLWLGIAYHE